MGGTTGVVVCYVAVDGGTGDTDDGVYGADMDTADYIDDTSHIYIRTSTE